MAMVSVEEALERVLGLSAPLPVERVPVQQALGRALAEALVARRTLPPHDTSAMDGYAVRAADLTGDVSTLRVVETLFAGQTPQRTVGPGECARIMTGAQVPKGADAVVMQERTRPAEGGLLEVLEAAKAGANIRRRGEDLVEGARVFEAGTALGAAEAAVLWAQGFADVAVRRRPTVAIASSGDELCAVGEEPAGRVVDTNSPVLAELVRRAGGVPTLLGAAADRPEALVETFGRGLSHDVLVTVAGASVGEKDFTREAFARLGVTIDFWQVAMKPGKPLALGRKGATLVFALPGNPVSAMVTFELFVRPALRALQGLAPGPPTLPGRAEVAISKAPGLRHFVRAHVVHREGALWATPTGTQSSGALMSVAGATHLVSLPAESAGVRPGDQIVLIPLSWG